MRVIKYFVFINVLGVPFTSEKSIDNNIQNEYLFIEILTPLNLFLLSLYIFYKLYAICLSKFNENCMQELYRLSFLIMH